MTSAVVHKIGRLGADLSWAVVKVAALLIGGELLLRKRTEVRVRELALRETNRRLNEFLTIASHEIKTPLASIKGYIQLTVRRLKNNTSKEAASSDERARVLQEAGELLERTDRQIDRLTRLVNELLDALHIQDNSLELFPGPCDLAAIVREGIESRCSIPTARTICLELPGVERMPVMADADRIRQVISNYLINSLKYSTSDRPITISLQVEGTMARISVYDQGPGIPISEQEHVWERFYRVPGIKVRNGSEVGLGLGLYISRAIIEQHHGQVGVQSAPGAGSTFWFTLPLLSSEMI